MTPEQSAFAFVLPEDNTLTIQDQFLAFHRLNPWVYRELVSLARQMKARGRQEIGIGMLWEVLRWNYYQQTAGDSEWKLNNNFRSRYARLIMASEPDLFDIFETRILRSLP